MCCCDDRDGIGCGVGDFCIGFYDKENRFNLKFFFYKLCFEFSCFFSFRVFSLFIGVLSDGLE